MSDSFWREWLSEEPELARSFLAEFRQTHTPLVLEREVRADVAGSDLSTSGLDLCPDCTAKLDSYLATARKRKAPDAGSVRDVERDDLPLAAQRLTKGGLYEPYEPAEDDRQPDLAAEYYATKGGLFTPNREPTITEKLRALWNEKPIPWQRGLTADQRAYRLTNGGLLTPEP